MPLSTSRSKTDTLCWQWSKSIYSYGLAACLFELGDADSKKEAAALMKEVPELRQRIAGKSIPMEVCRLPPFASD